jgi:hypothetical protein
MFHWYCRAGNACVDWPHGCGSLTPIVAPRNIDPAQCHGKVFSFISIAHHPFWEESLECRSPSDILVFLSMHAHLECYPKGGWLMIICSNSTICCFASWHRENARRRLGARHHVPRRTVTQVAKRANPTAQNRDPWLASVPIIRE